jgi:hypothetical protein
MKTVIKNNSVSVAYYAFIALVLIAFFGLTFEGIYQIMDWLSATATSFLTASQSR